MGGGGVQTPWTLTLDPPLFDATSHHATWPIRSTTQIRVVTRHQYEISVDISRGNQRWSCKMWAFYQANIFTNQQTNYTLTLKGK